MDILEETSPWKMNNGGSFGHFPWPVVVGVLRDGYCLNSSMGDSLIPRWVSENSLTPVRISAEGHWNGSFSLWKPADECVLFSFFSCPTLSGQRELYFSGFNFRLVYGFFFFYTRDSVFVSGCPFSSILCLLTLLADQGFTDSARSPYGRGRRWKSRGNPKREGATMTL